MAYLGFNKLKAKISARGGVRNPGAVAAAIGRKKYGKKKFQKAAASGSSLEHAKALTSAIRRARRRKS
jgi:hypothetical protein